MKINILFASILFLLMIFSIKPGFSSLLRDYRSDGFYMDEVSVRNEIMDEFDRWAGVRYQFGGASDNGIDCSSLMQKIYHSAFNNVPGARLLRTTAQQIEQGTQVRRNDLRVGDLIFFSQPSGNHVGVYIGEDEFIHASTSKGVMISTMKNDYWSKRFKQARRILA